MVLNIMQLTAEDNGLLMLFVSGKESHEKKDRQNPPKPFRYTLIIKR